MRSFYSFSLLNEIGTLELAFYTLQNSVYKNSPGRLQKAFRNDFVEKDRIELWSWKKAVDEQNDKNALP